MEASVSAAAVDALRRRYGDITPAGAGAWSRAFRFERDGLDLVVRVGPHVSDFRVDAEMSTHSSPALPIPEVFELAPLPPPHADLWACVSTYAAGVPLESVAADEWADLVPRIADLLETMRTVRPPDPAATPSWPETLLAQPPNDVRLQGWRDRLAARPRLFDAHETAMAQFASLSMLDPVATATPTLLHCDLINRNVHVSDGAITGVFDWGCRRWGDHLYDLAWFEFWSPWFPELDVGRLQAELAERWGAAPDTDRMTACLLHIGADHLVYNAAIDDPRGGEDVRRRMVDLGLL